MHHLRHLTDRFTALLALLLLFALAAMACDQVRAPIPLLAETPPPPPSVATVNGAPFLSKALERELTLLVNTSGLQPQGEAEGEEALRLKRSILNGLIDQALVLQAARGKGIELPEGTLEQEFSRLRGQYPDGSLAELLSEIRLTEEELFERRRELLLVEHYFAKEIFARQAVTEAEIEAHYQANPDEFSVPEGVRAAHIVVSTNDAAIGVLRELRAGLAFDEAARRYSVAPEGKNGGDLGFFPRGVMPPMFDKVCFELPVGRVSDIVPSDYGFHIFKVLEKKSAQRRGYELSHPLIERQLLRQKREEAEREHLDALRAAASITIDEVELRRVPLHR
ncbi:MAG: peptidyl-prolyl cis-trans isomerase [Myxococcales bacterium]|jgi:hypothetical protein|nr:peptidyl-prolyl cis-trans isomerase [Myxococcales bacterium]